MGFGGNGKGVLWRGGETGKGDGHSVQCADQTSRL